MARVRGIPNSFMLFGHEITVEYHKDLATADEDGEQIPVLGMALFDENLIKLRSPCKDVARSTLQQTFWHELTHHVFHKISELELAYDERIVDLVAQLLHQYETSKKV